MVDLDFAIRNSQFARPLPPMDLISDCEFRNGSRLPPDGFRMVDFEFRNPQSAIRNSQWLGFLCLLPMDPVKVVPMLTVLSMMLPYAGLPRASDHQPQAGSLMVSTLARGTACRRSWSGMPMPSSCTRMVMSSAQAMEQCTMPPSASITHLTAGWPECGARPPRERFARTCRQATLNTISGGRSVDLSHFCSQHQAKRQA